MKNIGGLVLFGAVFITIIAVSFAVGNYDPISAAVAQGQTQIAAGPTVTTWLSAGMNWLLGVAIGGFCIGFGVAAFNEVRKAYRLWKRQTQAGRWQAGPNAQFQRSQSVGPKLSRQDMLLLALSGRLPQAERPTATFQPNQSDDDDLNIEI